MPLVALTVEECDLLADVVEQNCPPGLAWSVKDVVGRLRGHAAMGRKPLVPSAED